jgi:tRNA dimethylallyltransferase
MPGDPPKPLVLVLGPTGSGKSDLALAIAERFGGEIVNCDSVQVYRGFDVGTAKTPLHERRGIPHHLFDIVEPGEIFTAGDYAREGRRVLADVSARRRVPVIAGGTGFYARALLEGLFEGPPRDEELRRHLAAREQRRPGFLHRALSRFDAAAAQRIHANDHNKLIRALEVCLAARRPITSLFQEGRNALVGYEPLKLVLNPPREELNYKLDRRCAAMLEGGWISEIKQLISSGVSSSSKPFESIGYKEGLALVEGRLSHPAALELMQRNTRRYAKRQLTWFRRESGVVWLAGFGTDPEVRSSAFEMLVKYLQNLE